MHIRYCYRCQQPLTGWITLDDGRRISPHICTPGPVASETSTWRSFARTILPYQQDIPGLLDQICSCISEGGDYRGGWLANDSEPFTYPSKCWKCQRLVLAHSNGFRDFVLLDLPPGRPWNVHQCYADRFAVTKRWEPGDLIREGFLSTCEVDPVPSPSNCRLVTKICPDIASHDNSKFLLRVAELAGGPRPERFRFDYWRKEIREGRLVWYVRDASGLLEIIPWSNPVRFPCGEDAENFLIQVTAGVRPIHLLRTPWAKEYIRGQILAIERIEEIIWLPAEGERRAWWPGGTNELLWVQSCTSSEEKAYLLPIFVDKRFASQGPGTEQCFVGIRQHYLGNLTCLVAGISAW